MRDNPLLELESYGQSVWLDFISRDLIQSGELARMIERDGLSGVTTNPAIFHKAISAGHDYDAEITELIREGLNEHAIYEAFTVMDVQSAADALRPVYNRTQGRDGFVSLEVSPHLANDTSGTVEQARRLWGLLGRPNVLIKSATEAGLPAIRQCIGDGINVNVTLLFGLERYEQVIEAYLAGLEDRVAAGQSVNSIASVASFFLSRIDTLLDAVLERLIHENPGAASLAREAHGQIAIACAKVAYRTYTRFVGQPRFTQLARQGARPQRLLWASTSTKNPAYRDTKYVEPLIGSDTVTTLPLETLGAYRDHGVPAPRLAEGAEPAAALLAKLPDIGIDLRDAVRQLEEDGIRKFIEPYDATMKALVERITAVPSSS